jgi:hypothetical protein
MNELQLTTSMGSGSPPIIGTVSLPTIPSVASTTGTGVALFGTIQKYLSNKPLRIRVTDDPETLERVTRLAESWMKDRPRGVDVEQMMDTPAYREIIDIGYRAIRPLLLMLLKNPDHWFYALHAITGENPVSPGSEGHLVEMAGAWIKWGKARGYIRDLD